MSAVIEQSRGTGPYSRKSEGFSPIRLPPNGRSSGRPLRTGHRRAEELAATFETIAREGARAFYKGKIAKQIAETSAAGGGHITEQILGEVEAEWKPPLKVGYRGYAVYSNGPQLLETLGLLAGFDLGRMEMDSPEHLHALLECLKQAQADQVAHGGDRTFDSASLLETTYLETRRRRLTARARPASVTSPWKLSAILRDDALRRRGLRRKHCLLDADPGQSFG